ncbi:MAG: hypothetical protein J2P36_04085 [Ktedonobacteraceae bacterium]|nr:hypothetical protein [Ktedonobacteraceae bacterium]
MPTDKDSHVANNVPLPASNNNTLFYFTRLDLTVQHPIVQTMWWWVLGAVDALMVFTIMLHGIRIMIAGSVFRYADAAQALPNILLALVAAQFSILIITAFLNLNNAMSLDTYNWANSDNTFKATAWGKVTSCQDSVIKKGDKVDGTDQITWLKPKDDKYLSNIGNVMDGKDDDKTLDDPNVYKHPETYHHMVLDPQYYKWVYEWVDPNHPNKPKMPSDPNHPTDAKKNPEFDESQYTEYAVRSLPAAVRAKPDPTFDKYYLVFAIKTTCKSWQNEIDEVFTQFPEIDTGGFWSNLLHSFGLMFESLTDFLKLVAGLSMLAVIGQMLIRFLLLNLYIVISPMGLASWALPGSVGRPLTQAWLKGFISLALVQFVQVVALIVAHSVASSVGQQLIDTLGQDSQNDVIRWLMAITFIWFILRIPSLLGSTPLATMLEVGQRTTQTAGAVVQHHTAILSGIAGFL